MTYGFRPEHWWSFQQELRVRGIAVSEIERVEMRPLAEPTDGGSRVVVTVTLRSGRADTWIHTEA